MQRVQVRTHEGGKCLPVAGARRAQERIGSGLRHAIPPTTS